MKHIQTSVLAGILAALMLLTAACGHETKDEPVPEEYQQSALVVVE